MLCPVCGQADLVLAIRDLPYTYKGQVITITQVEADWCDACGESITGPAESERVMQVMAKHRRQVNQAAGHQTLIREVRKGLLHLSQREAGELFGGGPNAFSRYERGETEPPVALVKLFGILRTHPELAEEVRQN
jgi:HTH-type transcriptional regulator/antitoxin MqsA